MRPLSPSSGEFRLFQAILFDALNDLRRYQPDPSRRPNTRINKRARDVRAWLADGEVDSPVSFRFELICAGLGIDPDYLRRGLKQWQPDRRLRSERTPTRTQPVDSKKYYYKKKMNTQKERATQ